MKGLAKLREQMLQDYLTDFLWEYRKDPSKESRGKTLGGMSQENSEATLGESRDESRKKHTWEYLPFGKNEGNLWNEEEISEGITENIPGRIPGEIQEGIPLANPLRIPGGFPK